MMEDRIVTYIRSLEKMNSALLEQIEEQAHIDQVPIIRKEMESFLRVILMIKKPESILELGTAVGYSALFMSECVKDTKIVTIENYEKRIAAARENIHKAGKIKLPWSKETLLKSCRRLMQNSLILSLWMPQRHSIFIFCQRCSG